MARVTVREGHKVGITLIDIRCGVLCRFVLTWGIEVRAGFW